MGLSEVEQEIVNNVRKKIVKTNKWKKRLPKIYGQIVDTATKEIEECRYDKDKRDDEFYYKKAELQVLNQCIRTDLLWAKEILGESLSLYKREEVYALLIKCFYDREDLELAKIFFRGTNVGAKSPVQAIHSNIKRGKFEYNYEAYFERYASSALSYVEKYELNEIRLRLREDGDDILYCARKKSMELQQVEDVFFCYEWNRWQRRIKEVEKIFFMELQEEKPSWIYLTDCIVLVGDSISYVIRQLLVLVTEASRNDILLNIRKYTDGWIEENNSRINKEALAARKNVKKTNLLNNYGVHLLLYVQKEERDILRLIYRTLAEENIPKLDAQYDITKREPQDVKENFRYYFEEKKSRVADETFKDRILACRTVLKWYREKHLLPTNENDLIHLKATYRELFVWKNVPKEITDEKAKAFVNSIKTDMQSDDEQNKLPVRNNMTEIETFYYEKIVRGVEREIGRCDNVKIRAHFCEVYCSCIEEVFDKKNMVGEYLIYWMLYFSELSRCLF